MIKIHDSKTIMEFTLFTHYFVTNITEKLKGQSLHFFRKII